MAKQRKGDTETTETNTQKSPPGARGPTGTPGGEGRHAGDYSPTTVPTAWIAKLAKHWGAAEYVELSYRSGSRGFWTPVATYTMAPQSERGDGQRGALELAEQVWRAAWDHCDEIGGPLDYRIVILSADKLELDKSTRGARLDTSGLARMPDLDSETVNDWARLADFNARALTRAQEMNLRLMSGAAESMARTSDLLGKLAESALEVARGGAEYVRAEAEARAKERESDRADDDQRARWDARQGRIEAFGVFLQDFGPAVKDAAVEWIRAQAQAATINAEARVRAQAQAQAPSEPAS